MVALFSALQAINPDLPSPEPDMTSLENPDVLEAELLAAGFEDVTVHRISDEADIASAPDFWADMVKGAAPVRLMQEAMGEAAWAGASDRAIRHLEANTGPFPVRLSMTAWMGTGCKPG